MSSYYGIVFPEFWTGDTGRAIQAQGGKDAQLAALYLTSCRHATMIGLYALPVRDIRHEVGLGQKGLVRAFHVLGVVGFSDYDARTEHVWVREMAKFRLGLQNRSPLDPDDKRVKGAQNLYDRLADNPFLEPFFDRYAKEIRLRRRRACGLVAAPLLDVALGRGFQGPCKPVNRLAGTEIRDQGSGDQEDQDQNLPPLTRRHSLAVENLLKTSEADDGPQGDHPQATLGGRQDGAPGRPIDERCGMESSMPGSDRDVGIRGTGGGSSVARDGVSRARPESDAGPAPDSARGNVSRALPTATRTTEGEAHADAGGVGHRRGSHAEARPRESLRTILDRAVGSPAHAR